jgi:hypothetical protein
MNLQVALRVRAESIVPHATTLHQILLRLKALSLPTFWSVS